jgi:hypothetical protein
MGVAGQASFQGLDETSRTAVPLDSDTLNIIAEKARQYVESLTGSLFRV